METFALFDAKLGEFLAPFYSQNQSTAVREMGTLLNNETHPITVHAEDYTLWHLGSFDPVTGEHRNAGNALMNLTNLKVNNA